MRCRTHHFKLTLRGSVATEAMAERIYKFMPDATLSSSEGVVTLEVDRKTGLSPEATLVSVLNACSMAQVRVKEVSIK